MMAQLLLLLFILCMGMSRIDSIRLPGPPIDLSIQILEKKGDLCRPSRTEAADLLAEKALFFIHCHS